MKILTALTCAMLASMAATPAFATTYNAVGGFSGSANPNGVWSYRDGGGNLLTHQDTTSAGSGWDNNTGYPNYSTVSVNASSNPVSSGTVIYGAEALHLDGQGVGAEVRFTSTTGGVFSLSGAFSYGDTSMATHTVTIKDDSGTVIFSQALTNGSSDPFSISNVALNAGGWLDFATGTDGGPSYAGTNLQLSVSDGLTAAPEPASVAMMSVALLGMGILRRKQI